MKKITLTIALLMLGLAVPSLKAANQMCTLVQVTNNPVLSSGTVIEVTEQNVRLIEHETGSIIDFEKPEVANIQIGNNYSFMKIIQSTPNGETVINILTTKLP